MARVLPYGHARALLLLLLLLVAGARADDLPTCHFFYNWTTLKACPFQQCQDRTGHRSVWDLSKCAKCITRADGTVMGSFLTCGQCQKGYALVGDRYRQECVALVDIRCDEWDGTHCRRCQEVPEVVKISFTLGPTYCAPAVRDRGPHTWSVANVCRTCTQLGCPGQCRSVVGCTSCPAGSVHLQLRRPDGLRPTEGYGHCTSPDPKPFDPLPSLPYICLRAKEGLGCPGAAEDGVGCTACPEGMKRKMARTTFIPGSQLLQAQPRGFGCFSV